MFKGLFLTLIVLVIPLFFVGVSILSAYNRLAALRNRVRAAHAQMNLGLKGQTLNGLTGELVSTQEKIAFARRAYNESVLNYNRARERFPTNLLAAIFHFEPARLLENGPGGEGNAPKAAFS